MKKILQFSLLIIIAYALSKFSFYFYDAYWTATTKFWNANLLPITIQSSFFVMVQAFVLLKIGKHIAQVKDLAIAANNNFWLDTKSKSQQVKTVLILFIGVIFAITFFLNFLSVLGLIVLKIVT